VIDAYPPGVVELLIIGVTLTKFFTL
jgi:hypothetical protein